MCLNIAFPLNESEENEDNIINDDDDTEEHFDVENTDNEETFILVNQRVDYQFRPKELEDICLYEFVRRFRKKRICQVDEIYFENEGVYVNDHDIKNLRLAVLFENTKRKIKERNSLWYSNFK